MYGMYGPGSGLGSLGSAISWLKISGMSGCVCHSSLSCFRVYGVLELG